MAWWVNIIFGILIGSFMSCYVPAYHNGFKAVLNRLAQTKKKNTKGKK